MNIVSDTKLFSKTLIFYFAFGFLFPSLRVLLIGHETAVGIVQYFVASLPELLLLSIIIHTGIQAIKSAERFKLNLFDWIILGFAGSNVLLGFFLAGNLKLSLYAFRMSYLPFVFYFLIRLYNFKEDDLKKTIYYIFISTASLVLIGHIMYFLMPNLMIEMIVKFGGMVTSYFIVRMTSILWTPVVFGTFAASGFLYFYYHTIENDKWSNYILMALMWSGLLLSVSRGAIIALLIGLIVFSCISFRLKPVIKTLGIMTLVFIALGYYINTPAEFAQWIWSSSMDTLHLKKGLTRVELWAKAFDDFKERPFGYGLGMAGHVAARFLSSSQENTDVYSTDGWFLKLANETGIWGLLSYLILAGTYFIMTVKKIKQSKNILLTFLLVFFIAFNIQSMVSNTLDFYLFSNLFWLMMGIGINQYYKPELGK